MHFFMTPFLAIVFAGWIVFHIFIKKDMVKHRNELYGGLIFIAIWIIIYSGLVLYAS